MSRSKSSIKPSPWQRYFFIFIVAWVLVLAVAYFFIDDVRSVVHELIQQFFAAP